MSARLAAGAHRSEMTIRKPRTSGLMNARRADRCEDISKINTTCCEDVCIAGSEAGGDRSLCSNKHFKFRRGTLIIIGQDRKPVMIHITPRNRQGE
jgi:hypothetical protein